MASKFLTAALAAFSVQLAAAQHAERCEPVAREAWRPQAELERRLQDRGWKISRVKITHGCYEVYGLDELGRSVEAFFHPTSFALVTAPG